jgi:hypothetical protein
MASKRMDAAERMDAAKPKATSVTSARLRP